MAEKLFATESLNLQCFSTRSVECVCSKLKHSLTTVGS